jgi:hypothetical protein
MALISNSFESAGEGAVTTGTEHGSLGPIDIGRSVAIAMKTATKPTGGVRIVAQDKDTLLLYWLDADGQPSRHMPPGIASIVRHRHGPLDVLWGAS